MFGYRRHSFGKAVEILNSLRQHPTNLQHLMSLHTLLISEILLAEDRIRHYRIHAAQQHSKHSQYYRSRLPSLRRSIYYWKMFGDAIAFLYIDRFALKHVFYNTKNTDPRQDAGFISGSTGFPLEIEAMNTLFHLGVPCVLTAVTNTIRYGDVCVLTGPDPSVIEVKASRTKDRRRARQRRNMQTLSEFYQTDEMSGFRGFPTVRRIAAPDCESHEPAFNQCINEAYEKGTSIISPEEGVEYIAIADPRISAQAALAQSRASEPSPFYLNAWKTDQAWAPYYPPTLLIATKRALYDFLLGRLHVVVLLDAAAMRQHAAEMGYNLNIVYDHPYPLRNRKTGTDIEANISIHLLQRAALEAVSLKWIFRSSIGAMEAHSGPHHGEPQGTNPTD